MRRFESDSRAGGRGGVEQSRDPDFPGNTDPVMVRAEERLNRFKTVRANLDSKTRLVTVATDQFAGLESFRLLAHRLEALRQQRSANRVLVTSAIPGEGKTFMAMNLAVTLARHSKSVLLVDGDLRRASVHQSLGVPGQPGLVELLQRDVSLTEAVCRVAPLDIFLLSPGGAAPDAPDLLGGAAMRDLMAELGTLFEWVIVDSPPLSPVVDAHVLARVTDTVLLVVRKDVTPLAGLDRALRALKEFNVAGVVMNDTSARVASSYYAYYPGRRESAVDTPDLTAKAERDS